MREIVLPRFTSADVARAFGCEPDPQLDAIVGGWEPHDAFAIGAAAIDAEYKRRQAEGDER